MKEHIKKAIEKYQCSGCVCGSDSSCYKKGFNLECDKHIAGTHVIPIGKIFLGMPKGFNRLGASDNLTIQIFESFNEKKWTYDKWNVPVWKWANDEHTFVRGLCPRTNTPFLHIILEDCLSLIECYQLTSEDIDGMD